LLFIEVNKHLTIVIPSKNEGRGLIEVLELIVDQIDCKIIVADSSDDEGSFLLLKNCSEELGNIKVIRGGLPSVARNNGAKLVRTPYVLFLDADTYVYNPFLIKESLLTAMQENCDLVTCRFRTDKPYRWVYRLFDVIQWVTAFTKPFALGGFMLFKTEAFNKLGGFNEEDKVAEDYRLSSKVEPKKFKVFNGYVYTSSRRFSKKGLRYMIWLMFRSWTNRNNSDFFKNDQNYWNEKD